MMATIDYDKSPGISTEERIKSLADSVRRAFEEIEAEMEAAGKKKEVITLEDLGGFPATGGTIDGSLRVTGETVLERPLSILSGGLGANNAKQGLKNLGVHDYIIENGISGIWKYQKWASGYIEYYGLLEATVSLDKTWGSIYYGSPIPAQELPFPLKEVFYSDAQIRFNNGWTGYSGTRTNPSLTLSEKVYPIGPKTLTGESCFVEYIVKGIIDDDETTEMTAAWDEYGNVTIYGATATHDGAGNVTIL